MTRHDKTVTLFFGRIVVWEVMFRRLQLHFGMAFFFNAFWELTDPVFADSLKTWPIRWPCQILKKKNNEDVHTLYSKKGEQDIYILYI